MALGEEGIIFLLSWSVYDMHASLTVKEYYNQFPSCASWKVILLPMLNKKIYIPSLFLSI